MSIYRDAKQDRVVQFFLSTTLGMAREVQCSSASRRKERLLIEWMDPLGGAEPLKIERQFYGKAMIIGLIGRIRAEDLEELKRQMDESAEAKALDLSEITIVDADVIPFLSLTEREGTRLVGCPLYVRGWIQRERAEEGV
jgi:hypothetical protein